MPNFTAPRLATTGAFVGGAAFAAAGALQATGLDWTENKVETPLQHATMVLLAIALVATAPAVAALGRLAGGRLGLGWIGIAVGQVAIAAAATVSNIRGVDAAWFPAAAVAANLLWIAGTFALAIALYRSRRVPRLVALGLIAAYVGAIPTGSFGGTLVTGCYWLAIGYLLSFGALERRSLLAATA